MRLLIVEEMPRFAGGSERISLSLARYARSHGHDVWLAYRHEEDMVPAYRHAGVITLPLPVRPVVAREPWRSLQAVWELRRAMLQARIDLAASSQVPLAPLLAAAAAGTRVRTAVHLGLVYDFPSPIFQRAMRAVDVAVAPSTRTAEQWKGRGWPADRLHVIDNGVDLDTFSPGDGRAAARARLGLDPGSLIIAYVGRLVAAKGVFTLVQAFVALHRQGAQARLVMVGAAPDDEATRLVDMARQAALPDGALEVRGPTRCPEDVYRAADIVVVPSEWDEPFGLVPLEAAACGTLAVVSDRGRLPEFVSVIGNQAVVRAGDANGLCNTLSYWLADAPRREAAATRLRTDVVARRSFTPCGDAYFRVFGSVLAA